jgi:hypothetical protein
MQHVVEEDKEAQTSRKQCKIKLNIHLHFPILIMKKKTTSTYYY